MDSPPPPLPPQSQLPVNWDALDALVLDFARSDRLVVPPASPSPPSSPSSSSTTTAASSFSAPSSSSFYRSRILIRRARRALEVGDVGDALALLRAHAPAALLDHRLLFHLHKQRFVELVRRGTEVDTEAALDCLRTALTPYALDAYPASLRRSDKAPGGPLPRRRLAGVAYGVRHSAVASVGRSAAAGSGRGRSAAAGSSRGSSAVAGSSRGSACRYHPRRRVLLPTPPSPSPTPPSPLGRRPTPPSPSPPGRRLRRPRPSLLSSVFLGFTLFSPHQQTLVLAVSSH